MLVTGLFSDPLDVIGDRTDIALLALTEEKASVEVYVDDSVNLIFARADALEQLVGNVALNLVEVPSRRVRPDDGSPGKVKRLCKRERPSALHGV